MEFEITEEVASGKTVTGSVTWGKNRLLVRIHTGWSCPHFQSQPQPTLILLTHVLEKRRGKAETVSAHARSDKSFFYLTMCAVK